MVWIMVVGGSKIPPPGALPAVFSASDQRYMCRVTINNSIICLCFKALLTICWPCLGQGHSPSTRKSSGSGLFCLPHKGLRKPAYWSVERGQHSSSLKGPGPSLFGDLNGDHIAEWILNDDNWFRFRCRVSPRGERGQLYVSFTWLNMNNDSTWMFNNWQKWLLRGTFSSWIT